MTNITISRCLIALWYLLVICACSSRDDLLRRWLETELKVSVYNNDLSALQRIVPGKLKCTDEILVIDAKIRVFDHIVLSGSPEILTYVISVDPNAVSTKGSYNGVEPLHYITGSISSSGEEWAVEKAKILIASGANVNALADTGNSPLHAIAFYKYNETSDPYTMSLSKMAKMMIEAGGDVDIENGKGETAMDLFRKNGWADLIVWIEQFEKRNRQNQ